MTEASPFPESLLTLAGEQTAIAAQKAKALKVNADEAAHIHKVWEDITSYLSRRWLLHLLALIDKEAPLLKKMKADDHPAIPFLEEIYRTTKEQAEELKSYRFPTYLEEACRAANLSLEKDSRHPHYKFEKGFFQLSVDDHKKTARLSDNETRLREFPADIEAIIEAVQRERKRVFERPFDAKKFLKKLRNQYLAVLKDEKLSDGSSILIRRITCRLGKKEKGFRTDEFLIDLSRLVEHRAIEIDGWQFELQQTKNTEQGMLLHGTAGRGYIGFILFKKV